MKIRDVATQVHSGLSVMLIGHGRLRTYLPWYIRRPIANHFAYRDWAQIAITVTNQFPGGDYFEFGSEGFRTLRNFLSAFHLNGHTDQFPDTRFFTFDIFGEPKPSETFKDVEKPYFQVYEGLGDYHYRTAVRRLRRHGLMLDRVELVKGHFEDTLNDAFKARLRAENRRVGFAFLDYDIAPSYKTCFDFLQDFINDGRAFIYMDEYFQTNEVPGMLEDFLQPSRNITACARTMSETPARSVPCLF